MKLNLNKRVLRNVMVSLSMILVLFGFRSVNYNVMVIANFTLYTSILILLKKEDFLFLIFISLFILFIQVRPLIDILNNVNWYSEWQGTNVRFALMQVYIALYSLNYGYKKYTLSISYSIPKNHKEILKSFQDMAKYIKKHVNDHLVFYQKTILVLFIFSFIFNLWVELDKFLFMKNRLYEEYYLFYAPNHNIIIKVFSGLFFYLFVLILSYLPTRNKVHLLFILYIICTIPTLLIGQRGSFIVSLLFYLIYVMYRKFILKEESWLQKKTIIIIVILMPIIVIFMSAINEVRHGNSLKVSSIFDIFISFMHKQGVSFNTYLMGVKHEQSINNYSMGKNYMFGEVIEFIKYNPISLKVFNKTPLPIGNNAIRAINGYSYAHILSYVSHHNYLNGYGFGTTYLSESIHTYGTIGSVLTNVFLGNMMNKIKIKFSQGVIFRFISLLIISRVIYLPRQPFSSLILIFLNPYLIMLLIFFFVLFITITNRKS